MSEAGHDLFFNILLDLCPFLSFLWRTGREKLPKISGLNSGQDLALWQGVIVTSDCFRSVCRLLVMASDTTHSDQSLMRRHP